MIPKHGLKIVLITGSRDYNDYNAFEKMMLSVDEVRECDILVCGDYDKGVDAMVEPFCEKWHKHIIKIPVLKWSWKDGRKAGPERNDRMFLTTRPALVVAFPLEGSTNGGTIGTIALAKLYGVPCITFEV